MVAAVLLFASLLRAEALLEKRGPLDGPQWTQSVQAGVTTAGSRLRPDALGWEAEPYLSGDPYGDLEYARQMRSFYQASVREPVFVYATRVVQGVIGDQEQAVCVVSAVFSVLTVWATVLVGRYVFSDWVGVAAALALAIEPDVISASVIGFKDDTFAFFLLLFAYSLLRARDDPTARRGYLCGLAGAGAVLTRITSITFVIPMLLFLAFEPTKHAWRRRTGTVMAALVMMALVVGPYLVNCWIEYGDPFFSISDRSRWYRGQLGLAAATPMNPVQFLLTQLRAAPATFVDTGVVGLTTCQLDYKWAGFDLWAPAIGAVLSPLAILGSFLMAWSPRGRALLLVTMLSTVPFIFTWTTPDFALVHHFRYTMPVYPTLLLAAFSVIALCVAAARASNVRRFLLGKAFRRSVLFKGAVTAAAFAATWGLLNLLPYLRLSEELALRGEAVLITGPRDRFFFRRGWYEPLPGDNMTVRFSRGRTARLWVPMIPHRPHTITLRLDPFVFPGAPPQTVKVTVNGVSVATFDLVWNPERIGEYTMEVPGVVASRRSVPIDLEADYSTVVGSVRGEDEDAPLAAGTGFDWMVDRDSDVAFRLWAVVVTAHPQVEFPSVSIVSPRAGPSASASCIDPGCSVTTGPATSRSWPRISHSMGLGTPVGGPTTPHAGQDRAVSLVDEERVKT